jgi:hypothetical protein
VWVRKRLLRPGQEAVLSNGDVIDLFCMRLLVNTFVKTADGTSRPWQLQSLAPTTDVQIGSTSYTAGSRT